nr:uncharacterized protein LOC117280697 [Nicotiana tomentosiformis]
MAGARGRRRGRGRVRPKKVPIVSFESSVGARIQGDGTLKAATMASFVQMAEEIRFVEIGSTSNSSGISKKLTMNEPPKTTTEAIIQRNTESKAVEINETVTSEQKSTEQIVEAAKQVGAWTNLFKENRSATNGMTLSYIPPQIVNGQTVVQLEVEEVEPEEEKWRCALIAYIIGDTPGYNAISRYISQNWLNIEAPYVYLHEEGYYVIRFNSITDIHTICFMLDHTPSVIALLFWNLGQRILISIRNFPLRSLYGSNSPTFQ